MTNAGNGDGPDPKTEEMNARNRVIVKVKKADLEKVEERCLFHVQGDWHAVDAAIVAVRVLAEHDPALQAEHLMIGSVPTGLGAIIAAPRRILHLMEEIGHRGDRVMFQFAGIVFKNREIRADNTTKEIIAANDAAGV